MQGIPRKIMKNHIFFSHHLALRRKCGKRVGILCGNNFVGTWLRRVHKMVLAGHVLPLPLQRKNQSPQGSWRVPGKNDMTATRHPFCRRRHNGQEIRIKATAMRSVHTDGERPGHGEGQAGERTPGQGKHAGLRHHRKASGSRRPGRRERTEVIRGKGRRRTNRRTGGRWRPAGKETGQRLTTPACRNRFHPKNRVTGIYYSGYSLTWPTCPQATG